MNDATVDRTRRDVLLRKLLPPAYIIAGGRSARFGSDKSLAVHDGTPNIVRLQQQLVALGCPTVTAVAREPDFYGSLGIETIADNFADCGPIAGLEAALTDATQRRQSDSVLMISCDLLQLKAAWIDELLNEAINTPKAGSIAFRGEWWEPFPGIYRASILPSAQSLLKSQGRGKSLQGLLNSSDVAARALAFPSDWPERLSFNTPEELASAANAH
ncbi:molybdenum cofactor guanylyltransferase [Stratiformator vulcanicus]|uniref:Molybdopterin-guanine dinucleotide biosynthesis protein MobA n=1 Tax=Stratiformator vulcanicus TaxID=2527980 RepID=A0A517QW52_9PLAN|nr:molybdenum cofactor guanylyltransferase [Stratiformator vulcanicus]QDT35871.1 molybdopterin-guanine dinucleotide biosynthesis protein MobA [Stratiformator vulcanicus]